MERIYAVLGLKTVGPGGNCYVAAYFVVALWRVFLYLK
jgi:hypothetical protein